MQRFSFGDAIDLGDVLSEAMVDGVRLAEDPEQKLRTLMIAAKESGMEVKTLFEFFDKNDDGEITPAEFAAALDRLDAGRNILKLEEDELDSLVQLFDKDGDGSISMNEFKHYCYNIKSLCWKAERVRLEGTGEFVGFVSEPAAGADGGASSASAARTPTSSRGLGHRETAPSAVLVHECTKLFWRTSEKLELMIYECSDFDLLLVASYDEDKGVAYPRVAIDIAKIRMMVDDEKLREEVKKRQQASDVDAAKTSATLLDAVRNESLANWVLSRLSFESGIGITINKLSNDPYDGDAVVPEPAVFETVIAPMGARDKVCADKYENMLEETKNATARLSRSSFEARRMTQELTIAMAAFSQGDPAAKGTKRNKYVTALLCGIRKQQVAAFQERLDSLSAKKDSTRSPRAA